LPLITTNRGGIPEITRDDCCITLNVDDSFVDNLADAILSLSTDNERCMNMSKTAATHAMQFNKDYYASNFFKAIEP
jgi:glycosyltransferase involved in cell wall biosynthesis